MGTYFIVTMYVARAEGEFNFFLKKRTLLSKVTNKNLTLYLELSHGQIQCWSSYANDEVVFPSYEMLNRLKNVQEVSLYSQTIYEYFTADLD